MSKDNKFPLITYPKQGSFFDWGVYHGESFKDSIKELAQIRKDLMLAKNPSLKDRLSELALKQWDVTKTFSPDMSQELAGIAQGADLSIEEIVILNNYTDFRDIQLENEGCSTIHIQKEKFSLSGQTWDMHKSAMDYLCVIHVPQTEKTPDSLVLSLVGCVGLMGIGANASLIGVNNINTKNAKAGLIWPALVRETLKGSNVEGMSKILNNAPVTSGHNYIISDPSRGEHWEITPEASECVSSCGPEEGEAFHTNHCLGEKIKPLEQEGAINSTTHIRYELIEKKVKEIKNFKEFYKLLTDHENYPKSICSHFESGAQDPSFTCGGGITQLPKESGKPFPARLWRGCPHENNPSYEEYLFESDGESWHRIV